MEVVSNDFLNIVFVCVTPSVPSCSISEYVVVRVMWLYIYVYVFSRLGALHLFFAYPALDGASGTSSHLCINGRSESLASEIMFRDFYPIHINREAHKSASLGLRRSFESKRLTTVRCRSLCATHTTAYRCHRISVV